MYIDFHCDTIIKYIENNKPKEIMSGKNSDINLQGLLDNDVKAQFMAIYLYNKDYDDAPNLGDITDWEYIELCVEYLRKIEEENSSVRLVKNYKDYIDSKEDRKLSLFTTIEDGRCVKEVSDVEKLKDLGISLVTLLWNYENSLGFPHSSKIVETNKGLKKLGIEVVKEMNDKGIIIDVSHLSDGGFWDVYKNTDSSFVASHSNSRAIQNHSRNLTDDQIKAIGNKGGIVGFNVFPNFTNGTEKASFKDYEKHISHIVEVGGEDIISWGTDFDGINGDYSINSPYKIMEFMDYLNLHGFDSSFIEKMAFKNAERFLKEFNWS